MSPPPGIVITPVEWSTGFRASVLCGDEPVIDEAFPAGSEPPPCQAPLAEGVTRWIGRLFR